MARNAVKLEPARHQSHTLATEDFPDRVEVDLGSDEPDNFTVVEIDDTPEQDRGRPTRVEDSILDQEEDDLREQLSARAQKRIDRLKFETSTERRAREAAERERDAAIELARNKEAELADLRRRAESGSRALADSMKSEREVRLADAKRRLAQAHADGDAEAIATATVDVGTASAELTQILAATPRRPDPADRAADAQPRQPAPAQPQVHPNARAWIERNPKFNTDQAFRAKAMSIHYDLEARNIRADDPRYVEELDKRMGTGYENREPDNGSRTEERPRRTESVAPGSREPAGKRTNPRVVELTSSELAVAKQLGLSPAQYAASKAKFSAKNTGA